MPPARVEEKWTRTEREREGEKIKKFFVIGVLKFPSERKIPTFFQQGERERERDILRVFFRREREKAFIIIIPARSWPEAR